MYQDSMFEYSSQNGILLHQYLLGKIKSWYEEITMSLPFLPWYHVTVCLGVKMNINSCLWLYTVKSCFWVFRWSNAINQIDSKIIWEWPEQRAYCYECLVWDHLNTWASSQNKQLIIQSQGQWLPTNLFPFKLFMFHSYSF